MRTILWTALVSFVTGLVVVNNDDAKSWFENVTEWGKKILSTTPEDLKKEEV